MKKISYLLSAALFALTFTACSVEDNPAATQEDLTKLVERTAAASAGDVVITLGANEVLTASGAIEAPEGKGLTIKGNADAPATIILADGGFVAGNSITIENVIIDASANTKPLVALSTEPGAELINDYYRVDNVTLKNVKATGVKSSIFFDNNKKYCVVDFTIENSVIELATESTKEQNQAFISFQQGGAKDFTLKNSTIYQTGKDEKNYFLRYHNSARLDRYGFDKNADTQSISYLNNTFYKVGNKGQWGNYNGIAGQKYSEFHVVGNIWVESGNGQVARRLLGSRNASSYTTCEFNNNTYWFNGAAETGNTQYDEGTQLTTDPDFVDAANADFTPQGKDQLEKKTGDPRWIK